MPNPSFLSKLTRNASTSLLPRDPALADGVAPRGTGFAILTVGATAGTRLIGKLADGTAISHGGLLDETGAVLVWLPLYPGGGGRLAGVLAFEDVTGTSHLAGTLQWVSHPSPGRSTHKASPPRSQPSVHRARLAVKQDFTTGLRTGTFYDPVTGKKRTFYLLSQSLLNRCEGFFLGETEGGLAQLLPGL